VRQTRRVGMPSAVVQTVTASSISAMSPPPRSLQSFEHMF
jgi:hypothetical protein